MAYSYSKGPIETSQAIPAIAEIMKDIAAARRFMGLRRRLTVALNRTYFGSFVPTAEDDPFDAGPASDWQIGFGTEFSVTNSMNMTYTQAYRVVFKVYDQGSSRRVVAKVRGVGGFRSESEKLVKMVFEALQ